MHYVQVGNSLSDNAKGSDNIEQLSKKLDQILHRLDLLEELIVEKPEYEGLTAALKLTRVGIGIYGEPLKIATRLKKAQKYLEQKQISQDEIARYIIQTLAVKGPLNISAITRQVAVMRGKASRRIIRERIQKLLSQSIVTKDESKPPTYDLTSKTDQ
jgi:hypothetical protein